MLLLAGCNNKPDNPPDAEEKTWTISFDSDGGSEVESITVKDGEVATAPERPTKTGYDLVGWYEGETAFDWEAVITADHALKASWTPTKYTITYELNDGTKAEDGTYPEEYTIETETFSISDAVPPAGKYWDNWYESEDAEEPATTTIEKGSTGNLTLYARYSDTPTFKVTFDSNGGSAVTAQNVKENDVAKKPTDPTKSGFVFDGWYTDKELKTAFDFTTKVTAALTLYAKWKEAVKYTITFDSDGGTEVASLTVESGKVATAPKAPTKDGYTFDGWYNGETKFDWTKAITGDVSLKAKWIEVTPDSCIITFDSDGGTDVAAITVDKDKAATEPTVPTREGYYFLGWYNGSTKFDWSTKLSENISLKAKWLQKVTETRTDIYTLSGTVDLVLTGNPSENSNSYTGADAVRLGLNVPLSVGQDVLLTFSKFEVKNGDNVISADNAISELTLAKNQTYNYQIVFTWLKDGATLPAEGDTLKLSFTCTSEVNLSETELKAFIVSNGTAGGWDLQTSETVVTVTKDSSTAKVKVDDILVMNVGSYESICTAADLQGFVDSAVDGDVNIILKVHFPAELENSYDYVGKWAGWDENYENVAADTFGDDQSDWVLKLKGADVSEGAKYEFTYKASDMLALSVDRFCVNIFSGKIAVDQVVASYMKKTE